MPDKETFGKRMKTLRKKQGLTQAELAYQIGVHEMTIRRWETGVRTVENINDIKRLASALHVSEEELLNGVPEQSAWVLQIKVEQDFKEEFIDMSKNIPCIASLHITPQGCVLTLGGDYSLWTDDKKFKNFINDIKKSRELVIHNGRSLGGIKE